MTMSYARFRIFVLLAIAAGLSLFAHAAGAQQYSRFGPANGILVGNTATPQTTAATASTVINLWTGTCDATTFLRADGSCVSAGGGGGGSVTSVGLTMPSGFSVGSSPVTTSGTIAVTTSLSGVLFGTGSGITAAANANVISLWTGTCSAGTFLRGDGACAAPTVPAAANPSGTIGLTATNGMATTFARSDATHALSQSIVPTWTGLHTFSVNPIATGYIAGADNGGISASVGFLSNIPASTHGHYGFLDDAANSYPTSGVIGYASFNDDSDILGAGNTNHHHSFQSSPHFGASGNLDVLSSYWALPDVTGAGTVAEVAEFKANNPTGSGAITTLYGFYAPGMSRGTTNWAFYAGGTTESYFGGNVGIGGSINPNYKLHLKQSSDSSGFAGLGIEANGTDRVYGVAYNSGADEWRMVASYDTGGAYSPLTFWTSDIKRVTIANDGGVVLAAATGASKGAGTINATGVYVNGVAVAGGGKEAFAQIIVSGACTISSSYDKVNVTGCTYNSAGNVTLTLGFTASLLPVCTATKGTADAVGFIGTTGLSTTTVRVTTWGIAGTPADSSFQIICKGN